MGGEFFAVFLFAEFEGVAVAGELEFGEVDLVAVGELFLLQGAAIGGDLEARLLAEVCEFQALGVAEFEGVLLFQFAVFVGEDAVEVFEEGGAGFGRGGEFEGALFDDLEPGGIELGGAGGVEVAEVIDGGFGVVGNQELMGEVELGAVAVEGGDGKVGAEVHVELLLDVFQGASAEEVVDEIELVRAQMGEFGEGLEGAGARAARGDF